MKKTLRFLSLLLCAVLLCSVLAGCHGRRAMPTFSVPSTFDTSKTYEISFWAKNDTNQNQAKVFRDAIESFSAYYPNIHVTIRPYTDYNDIYKDVLRNLSTGTTPNICITYPDHIATYLTGLNTVVPLDDLMDDPRYGLGGSEVPFDAPTKAQIVPEFLEGCKIGSETYALPFMRSTEACYINKDMVESLGYEIPDVLTWDFIFEVSEAAMEKDPETGLYKVNGQSVLIPFIYKSTDNMMIQYLEQAGAGYTDEDGQILIFNDTTRALLKEVGEHAATRSFSTFAYSSYPGNYFNIGQCIFAVDSTAGATWIGCNSPLHDVVLQDITFETVVRPVPQVDPENPRMISQGPSVCIFNKEDPGEVMASWLFVQFLLTDEIQIPFSKTEGYTPVTLKARNSEEYKTYLSLRGADEEEHYTVKIDATKLLLEHTADTFTTPVYNGSASLRQASGQLIDSVNRAAKRGETIDDRYLDTLFENITSLYKLNQIGKKASIRTDLGGLPPVSVALLVTLAVVWVGLGALFAVRAVRKKRGKAGQNG